MFKLLIDTRERARLNFRDGIFEQIEQRCLKVGDYGCEINGQMVPWVAERKSLPDLYGTMTKNYHRFKAELKRAKELNIKLVLMIEGTMREVAKGYEHSQFDGDSMLKKLAMLYVKYDLEYYFCGDRREMARRIEETFCAVARHWKKEKLIS